MAKKKIHSEEIRLDITVGGNKAQLQLGKLEEEARDIKNQLKEVSREIAKTKDKDSEAYRTMVKHRKELNVQLKENRLKQSQVREQVGLTGLTYRQLRSEAKRLQTLLANSTYGTPQWRRLNKELKQVQSRMQVVKAGATKANFSLRKMTDGFNRYFGMVSTFILGFTGIIAGFRKAFLAFADFDDKLADVMKTTNLTKDEVKDLNKEFEKIDTRTAQEDLLDLAWVAGKLGIQGKQEVLKFVEAADMINVALSKDLGGNAEDAIREIGKLTDIFNLTDDYTLEESLLKVGSAINSLGMASTASEPYLVEFTKRVAGIAPSANISIDKILGLGATLDQLGQSSSVASTVYSQVVPNMFKDTDTYATIAKMSVSEFTKLLNSDANEAFIRMLEGLNGNNEGFGILVNKLAELGLQGKRATSVMGVLANNTNVLRDQQALANEEFNKGTSIIEEFNIKNTTARAGLDKAIKKIKKFWRELGEKLQPVLAKIISKGSAMVRMLSHLVDWFKRNNRTISITTKVILTAVAAWVSYNTTIKITQRLTRINQSLKLAYASVIGVLTGKIKLATAATKTWNKVSKLNPIGLVVGALATAATAFVSFKKKVKDARKEQEKFNEAIYRSQQLMDNLKSIDERFSNLDLLNKRQLQDLKTDLQTELSYLEDSKIKALEIGKKYHDKWLKMNNEFNKIYKENPDDLRLPELRFKIKNYEQYYSKMVKNELGMTDIELQQNEARLKNYIKHVDKKIEHAEKLDENNTNTDPGGPLNTELTKSNAEQIKKQYSELLDYIEVLEMDATEREMNNLVKARDQRLQVIKDALALELLSEEEADQMRKQLDEDLMIATAKIIEEDNKKKEDEEYAHQQKLFEIRKQYGLVTTEELNEKELELLYKQHLDGLLSEEDYIAAKKLLEENHRKEKEAEEEKTEQKINNIRAQYGLISFQEQKEQELSILKKHLDDKLLSEEEFKIAKDELDKRYSDLEKRRKDELLQASLSTFADLFDSMAGMYEEGSQQHKAFSIMKITADSIAAAMAAYNSVVGTPVVGPVLAPIAAAAAAAFGMAQIKKINELEVPQYFSGYYDVFGERDKKRYKAKYKGVPTTDYVGEPSLFLAGDDPHRLQEMIISGPDLKHPVIADYARAIMDIKYNRSPQQFSPSPVNAPGRSEAVSPQIYTDPKLIQLLTSIDERLQEPTRAKVVYTDFDKAKEKVESIRTNVSR